MKKILASMAVIGLFLCSATSAFAVQVGKIAPDFQSETIEGKEFTLSDYKGEPILLKIGTTWCPSCRIQSKELSSMHQYLEEKGIRFVDVFIDESESSVNKFFTKGEFNRPTVTILDEGAAATAYNVYVIPRLILIDKDFIVHRDGDTISARNLKSKIEKMLKSD